VFFRRNCDATWGRDFDPSIPTLYLRWFHPKQLGNISRIFAIVLLYYTCGRHVPLGFKVCHLLQHCCFVRPGTRAEIPAQSAPLYFSTASVSVLSSSVVHLHLRAFVSSLFKCRALCHLLRHCVFVRPETSAAIAAKSSPLCFSTASFSVMSSSVVHLRLRAVVSSLLESNTEFHLP
jgi:hypothetical protein